MTTMPLLAAENPTRAILYTAENKETLQLSGTIGKNGAFILDPSATTSTTAKSGPVKGKEYTFGSVSTGKVKLAKPFDQIVVSWNAETPAGTWLILEARAKGEKGWTDWFNLGYWTLEDSTFSRTSVTRQRRVDGKVDTDTLILTKPTDESEVRATLCSLSPSVTPSLKLLAVSYASSSEKTSEEKEKSDVWGKVLDVPEISQLSYPPKGNVWCSPTSTTMVMNYWADKKKNKAWETDVRTAAACIADKAWGGTGNWTFNTAYAGSKPGLIAFCDRYNSMEAVEAWIAKGVPVILSISTNILYDRDISGGGGHLIVAVGFDEKGDVVVNDPYAKLEEGKKVRRVYDRQKLLRSWRSSLGTSYIIYPEGYL